MLVIKSVANVSHPQVTSCGIRIDRDANAARNITALGPLRFDKSEGQQIESMVQAASGVTYCPRQAGRTREVEIIYGLVIVR